MKGFFKRVLKALNKSKFCWLVRRGGKHAEVWHSDKTNNTFPVSSNMASRHTANDIMKQAGIDKKF